MNPHTPISKLSAYAILKLYIGASLFSPTKVVTACVMLYSCLKIILEALIYNI